MAALVPTPFKSTCLMVACLVLAAPGLSAQALTHVGQDAYTNTQQSVELVDAWDDGGADSFFDAKPRDVLVKVQTRSDAILRKDVELLLHGHWGWFHLSFPEESLETIDELTLHHATTWIRLDIDADGDNEIVLIERRLEARRELDASGYSVTDAPLLSNYTVSIRYLDRSGESLLQHPIDPDPGDASFALLLQTELGGTVHAALQLAAADFEFDQQEYAKARYRLLTVKEWAERALPARSRDDLNVKMELYDPDVNDPSVAWISAIRKHSTLPPYYRRHR